MGGNSCHRRKRDKSKDGLSGWCALVRAQKFTRLAPGENSSLPDRERWA